MSDGYSSLKLVNEYPLHLLPTLYAEKSAAPLRIGNTLQLSMEEQIHNNNMESDVTNNPSAPSNNSNNPPPSNSNCDQGAVDFVLEHGPGICATVEECRTTLLTVGANKITPAAVARIMTGMIKAHELHQQNQNSNNSSNQQSQQQQSVWGDNSSSNSTKDKDKDRGGSDSSNSTSGGGPFWNGKVFVQAVLDFVPTLTWKDVFRELDFPGFFIPDGRCFRALIETLKYGMQLQGQSRPDQFPVDTFLRRWNNAEGQASLLKACLNAANCDIFSFADYPFHAVATDMLKTTGDKSYDAKEIAVWKSMELLDLLLNLSDGGVYPIVQEVFQFPMTHCPDILILGLIQISSPMNVLRQNLISALFPVFLGNHINSGVILQYAWNNGSNTMRPIMIHAMADWYLGGDYDQTKLSRILDVAQDLKALHLLLNASSHVFIIDLACLASRREFLKLDKWLSDKIREHGEPFLASLLKVLNRRVPIIFGKPEEGLSKTAQLPPETLSTLIQCMAQCSGKVSMELSESIVTMVNAYQMLINKSRLPPGPGAGGGGGPQQQPPPGVLRPPRSINSLELAFSNSSSAPGQLFPSQVSGVGDPLGSLGSSFGGLNLASSSSGGTSGGGGSGFGYNPLGPTPGSPSRLLGPGFNSQNPAVSTTAYPMLSGLQQLGPNNSGGSSGSGAAGGPNVAAVSAALMSGSGGGANPMGMLGGRLGPNPQGPAGSGGGGGPSVIGGSGGPAGDKRGGGLTDNALLFSDIQGEISKEAEDEANNYFHRIYSKPPVSSTKI
jgi:CCR4-NOT transcription complex subunit 1